MPADSHDLLEAMERFEPVGLDELDARAALQKRVDNKYLVPAAAVAEVSAALRRDHQALEIDGRRAFRYERVYFDTPRLDCFAAHVEERRPRFKVRTRLYADSGECSLEVNLKRADGETHKATRDHVPELRDRLDGEARAWVDEQLGADAPEELAPALVTRFRRATLGAKDEPTRVTLDVDLRLVR